MRWIDAKCNCRSFGVPDRSREAAVGHAAGVYEKSRGDYAEEKSADMGEICDAAGLGLGDCADVEDLD
jgi:hypothetical protein